MSEKNEIFVRAENNNDIRLFVSEFMAALSRPVSSDICVEAEKALITAVFLYYYNYVTDKCRVIENVVSFIRAGIDSAAMYYAFDEVLTSDPGSPTAEYYKKYLQLSGKDKEQVAKTAYIDLDRFVNIVNMLSFTPCPRE